MKSYLRFAAPLLVALSTVMYGCDDEVPVPGPDEPSSDPYAGDVRTLTLGAETRHFPYQNITLRLKAPDGTLVVRPGVHSRNGELSRIDLATGLKDGEYEMLCLEYPTAENPEIADLAEEFATAEFALGAKIKVAEGHVEVLDRYDSVIGLYGEGTADNPYKISSYDGLMNLALYVNSEENNGKITSDTYFVQTDSIDMYKACRSVDRQYGWNPIGANPALPFRGHYQGNAISTLIIDRGHTAGVGLFGYVHNARFDNIRFYNSSIKGNFAVGLIAGASLCSGADRGIVAMTGCTASGCEIYGSEESLNVGALLGAVDMSSQAFMQSCSSFGNKVEATYNAGGLAGGCGLYSAVQLNDCYNTSEVKAGYSGAGGMIGTADTLFMTGSRNAGVIAGGLQYTPGKSDRSAIGAGGLAGGAGMATVSSCINSGAVQGYSGVGGIVGSTRVKGSATEAYVYNNVLARYCGNTGDISGTECIGGIVGESQVGTYAVYNTGRITGDDYVAGIAGCTSIAVAHNAVNTGEVSGAKYVSGIIGKTLMGSLALDHNYGRINGSDSHLAGVVALAGNNTMVHYCGNYGKLTSTGNGPVGGIVGEIGDPRKWTAMNICDCVLGSADIIMGFLGPVIAVTSHVIEATAETVANMLELVEVAVDGVLHVSDAVILGLSALELLENEELVELSSELQAKASDINDEVKAEISRLRREGSSSPSGFDKTAFSTGYNGNVDATLAYYEGDGNSERFNEQINIKRERRAENLEKSHQTTEIIHDVIGGVCCVVGAVAAVGATVASGGAAVPFIIAGTVTSIAGGLNAITKSCLEFENNAVIISQCVNAADISAPAGNVGGLVGNLWDASILRDCINTGNGPKFGSPFAGHCGGSVDMYRLISLANRSTWCDLYKIDGRSLVIYDPECEFTPTGNIHLMNTKTLSNPKYYKEIDSEWIVGDGECLWNMGSSASNSFPVPAWSEMRENY